VTITHGGFRIAPPPEHMNLVENAMGHSRVVELRQYTVYGGQRDRLAQLFAKEFVSAQEAVGAQILGAFRDLDDPDRFVWFRGFESMEIRARAMTDFYDGPVWKTHRDAANAAMLDSGNALLLQPAAGGPTVPRLELTAAQILGVWIHYLGSLPTADFADFHRTEVMPKFEELGVRPVFKLETNPQPNNFPRHPVRPDRVFVWGAIFADRAALRDFDAARSRLSGWRDRAPLSLLPALMCKPERLLLAAF
jgi:hypothetical protein